MHSQASAAHETAAGLHFSAIKDGRCVDF